MCGFLYTKSADLPVDGFFVGQSLFYDCEAFVQKGRSDSDAKSFSVHQPSKCLMMTSILDLYSTNATRIGVTHLIIKR